ncbi:biotin/lipoate A/B protein ligase [Acidimicrobium ferrooxidans DSM 10331]|uniref:Biotin/lipoate A/B protein ligase n=1 Tax=Acidimicrobium ferrooxidans (strain DSM 10331 / JCM 15462 / NBRC 103882 / ICP) TaxID=525909 RepID=C7LZM7_ACIFD|nr:biotin/lipoate A/B protein ligase [Acidimicrobium ferrooxidans DSM 10331]
MQPWRTLRLRAPASVIHRWWPADEGSPWLLSAEPTAPTVVLGSTTRVDAIDAASLVAKGYDIVRRGSGGGAVVVAPGEQAWFHVFVPASDPRLDPHLGRSFLWLGEAVAEALGALGVADVTVVREVPERVPLSTQVCFAGWGWGEVAVGGNKVAGLAQRRRRGGAIFQVAVLWRDRQRELVDALRDRPEGTMASLGLEQLGIELDPLVATVRRAILAR